MRTCALNRCVFSLFNCISISRNIEHIKSINLVLLLLLSPLLTVIGACENSAS